VRTSGYFGAEEAHEPALSFPAAAPEARPIAAEACSALHEPAVTLTDLALALECGVFAFLIARRTGSDELRWSLVAFFAGLGMASLLGALVHGFVPDERAIAHRVLWRMVLLALGVAAFAAWRGGATVVLGSRLVRVASFAAAAALVGYAGVVLTFSDRFVVAVVYYVPAASFLLICLAVEVGRRPARRLARAPLGLALSLLASGMQQLGIGLHPVYFDHNALYHVIEMGALVLVFRGAGEG
jgi:hypothetical protein